MSFELENLRSKAERLQLEALVASGHTAQLELAARLYDDAAGYWQALGGRSLEVGECLANAQACRRKAEGRG